MALSLRRFLLSNNALYGSLRTMRAATQPVYMFSALPPRSSLSQILNMMDQFKDFRMSFTIRKSLFARAAEDGIHLRMNMRGLGEEDIKVSVEQSTLIIQVEGKKESGRIDLPEKLYEVNNIKTEMKNGVMKVFVPSTPQLRRFVCYINDLIVK